MNKSPNQRFSFFFAALLAVGVAARLRGATPAPAWEQRLQTQPASTGQPNISAFRVLADTSTMGVWQDGLALTIQRHDEEGNRLSASAVYPPLTVTKVAIDFFGSVFVIAPGPGFWTMKYDGFTGKAMWPAPARLDVSKDAYATALAVDRTGDVFVAGRSSSEPGAVVKYDGRTGALRWGPVSLGTTAEYVMPAEMIVDPFGDPVVTS